MTVPLLLEISCYFSGGRFDSNGFGLGNVGDFEFIYCVIFADGEIDSLEADRQFRLKMPAHRIALHHNIMLCGC